MLAIIRKGNGQYYTSLVFGYYSVSSSIEDIFLELNEKMPD